jgi:hypothetical protein
MPHFPCPHGITLSAEKQAIIDAAFANGQIAAVCPDCREVIVFPPEIIGSPPLYENDFDLMNRVIAEHRSGHA